MRKRFLAGVIVIAAASLCGCMTKTAYIDHSNAQVVAGFSEDDITHSIRSAMNSIISLDRIKPLPGSNRAIVVIPNVTNDTLSRGRDADALAEALALSIREELTNSGKILVFNPSAAQYATVQVKPQYSLHGRLTQRVLRQDNGDVQIEYNLNLQLVDLATGLEFWQKRVPLRKIADARNVM